MDIWLYNARFECKWNDKYIVYRDSIRNPTGRNDVAIYRTNKFKFETNLLLFRSSNDYEGDSVRRRYSDSSIFKHDVVRRGHDF